MAFNMSLEISEEDKLDMWNNKVAEKLAPLTAVFVFYVITGCVGNSFVMYVHWFRIKTHYDDRFFIPCLALFDTIACMVCTISGSFANLYPVRFSSDIGCKMAAFLSLLFVNSSADLLVIIAVERYQKLCKPFKTQMSMRRKKHSIFLIFVIATITAGPIVCFFGASPVHHPVLNVTGWRCTNLPSSQKKMDVAYTIFLLIYTLVRYVILTFLYILIGRSVFRQIQARQSLSCEKTTTKCNVREASSSDGQEGHDENDERDSHQPNVLSVYEHETETTTQSGLMKATAYTKLNSRRRMRRGLRLSFIFMLITLIYIITFLPKLVLMIIEAIDINFWTRKSLPEVIGYRFLYYIFVVNNIANPFIYGFFDKMFRKQFILLICKRKNG